MPPLTNGFADNSSLMSHFYDHGRQCGARTPADYLNRAEEFMAGPITKGTMECQRRARWPGDRVRYNTVTDEFGVMTLQRVIVTYFIVEQDQHGFASNLEYFEANCPPKR